MVRLKLRMKPVTNETLVEYWSGAGSLWSNSGRLLARAARLLVTHLQTLSNTFKLLVRQVLF